MGGSRGLRSQCCLLWPNHSPQWPPLKWGAAGGAKIAPGFGAKTPGQSAQAIVSVLITSSRIVSVLTKRVLTRCVLTISSRIVSVLIIGG